MIRRIVQGLLLVALALGFVGAGAAQAKTVKVGIVMTYSGGAASLGENVQRAIDLYMDQEGNKKLGDIKVEWIKRDSKRPGGDIAKTAVQELIVNEKIDILTGFIFSPNIIASVPLIKQSKTPTLILNAGTAWITNMDPHLARVSFSMWHSGYPLGQYAATKLGCKTAAVGYTDYPPGKDSRDSFVMSFEANGGKVLESVPMGSPAQVPDFTPFMQRVKDAKPNCFYVFVPAGQHVAGVFKTYNALGMRAAGIKLIGPADLTQDTELQGIGKESVGGLTIGHYQADLYNPVNKRFVAAWKAKYGKASTPDFMAVSGYDGAAAIVDAIVQQNGNIDAERTMKIWAGWKHDSPRGPIMIDPVTRDVVQDIKLFEITAQGDRRVMKTLDTSPQVKDPCKEHKVGKCAE